MNSNSPDPKLKPSPWQQTLAAVKANIVPGLILQAFALVLVLAYYFYPPVHQALDIVAEFKNKMGWRYSIPATGIFGGVIPSLFLRLNPRTRAATPYSHVFFYILFWAYKGFEVDQFYQFQGWLFGNETTFLIIAKKVLVDQFGYTGLYSAPTAAVIYYWKDSGFQFSSLKNLNWIRFQKDNLPKALLTTWIVWIPSVAIIYSLPPALQIPLFNIVLCFYSFLYITLMSAKKKN